MFAFRFGTNGVITDDLRRGMPLTELREGGLNLTENHGDWMLESGGAVANLAHTLFLRISPPAQHIRAACPRAV
jgi:hypothetical protein